MVKQAMHEVKHEVKQVKREVKREVKQGEAQLVGHGEAWAVDSSCGASKGRLPGELPAA